MRKICFSMFHQTVKVQKNSGGSSNFLAPISGDLKKRFFLFILASGKEFVEIPGKTRELLKMTSYFKNTCKCYVCRSYDQLECSSCCFFFELNILPQKVSQVKTLSNPNWH